MELLLHSAHRQSFSLLSEARRRKLEDPRGPPPGSADIVQVLEILRVGASYASAEAHPRWNTQLTLYALRRERHRTFERPNFLNLHKYARESASNLQ